MVNRKSGETPKGETKPKEVSWKLRWAFTQAEEMELRDLCLEKLSAEAGLSKCYLSRNFPLIAGYSFEEYRKNRRITETKRLLTETPMFLEQIAFALGFARLEDFTIFGEETTGYKPKAFRDYYVANGRFPPDKGGATKPLK